MTKVRACAVARPLPQCGVRTCRLTHRGRVQPPPISAATPGFSHDAAPGLRGQQADALRGRVGSHSAHVASGAEAPAGWLAPGHLPNRFWGFPMTKLYPMTLGERTARAAKVGSATALSCNNARSLP